MIDARKKRFDRIEKIRQSLMSEGVKRSQIFDRLQKKGYSVQTINWFFYHNQHKYLRDTWGGGE